MQFSLSADALSGITSRLAEANQQFAAHYPGDAGRRQPVHSVYGGAHLFKADTAQKLGALGLKSLDDYAATAPALAEALGLPLADPLTGVLYERVRRKLQTEPVEDLRIDFEDGYGYRAEAEEDGHAVAAAGQLAAGLAAKTLSPYCGLRPKAFSAASFARAVRTLDLVLTHLVGQSGGQVPGHFIITLPKVAHPAQVESLARVLVLLEARLGLPAGVFAIDLMIETTSAIINERGQLAARQLVEAGQGRVKSVAFGTYDYTAACNIVAAYQNHTHPAANFARQALQVSLAGMDVTLSDGATTLIPVGPHRAGAGQTLTPGQQAENRAAVHRAWRIHFENIRYSLAQGYYQGWDLHPAQLPIRYAALYTFFLENLAEATARLQNFIQQAAQASLLGNTFDDAATGQGLLNFFLRGLACGALTQEEVLATGLTLPELHGRSFAQIVASRAST
jgi:citrate lyase beta subunit